MLKTSRWVAGSSFYRPATWRQLEVALQPPSEAGAV